MAFVAGNIPRGSHVVLRDSEGFQKVFSLHAKCVDLHMGRYGAIPAEAVLAAPYGATLRKEASGQWERVRRVADTPESEKAEEVPVEDNRNLAQDNSAQGLSPAEVRALKGTCSGGEVVEALASNSATFASKTKFAQEKYLKKKQQKHVQQVVLLRPTVMELCETYLKHMRNKVCGLRFDYLSSLLCHADVCSGRRYFVLDCAAGLVTGAISQQMAGHGQVYRVFRGGCPEKGLNELDLSEAERNSVRPLALEVLLSSDPMSLEWLRPPAGIDHEIPQEAEAHAAQRQEARTSRYQQRLADFQALEAAPVDSVVIVAGDDEELEADALEAGLARLAPGGRVVVFGHHLQPLASLQGSWRAGHFVDVRLEQLFTREYQVLPLRTHPHMVADAQLCEGFILSACKVIATSDTDAVDASGGGADDTVRTGKRRRRS
eukprot:TRINITY_DN33065_c0_g1_i1.p1 TRINITY_DN33065_c0_g1~~TRINITY_DN33065_c0_g1_i1.p1  ORF type:complete len:433 (+),score=89.16 TRINITY_DN33065_c0_g1_i1:44-1342(+)